MVPVYKAGIRFTNTLTDYGGAAFSIYQKKRHDPLEKECVAYGPGYSRLKVLRSIFPVSIASRRSVSPACLIETDSPLARDRLYEMVMALDGARVSVTDRIA